MQGNNFYFNGGTDPILNGNSSYISQVDDIARMKEIISKREAELKKMQSNMIQQHNQNATPVWDEIDSITKGLSEKEFQIISSNDEFIESQDLIMGILQSKYMQMMRPVVECSKEGKEALERHLTLLKRLRKCASAEIETEIDEFKEFKEKYSNMTYEEYKSMKRNKTKKR